MSLSKRNVPFRSSHNSLESSKKSVRSYSKFLDKKGMADRKPFNILAHESNLQQRRESQSRGRRSVSNSKLIKASIMRGAEDC